MALSVEVDSISLAPVVLNHSFDLQAYQELGLDLSRLVDYSEDGLLRNLRLAAGRFVVNASQSDEIKSRYGRRLSDAYDNVEEERQAAEAKYLDKTEDLTIDHPAVQSYIERNPEALDNASTEWHCTSRIVIEEAIAMRKWFSLILIKPNDISSSDEREVEKIPPWKVIESSHCGIVSRDDVFEVAPQLVEARIAIAGILL